MLRRLLLAFVLSITVFQGIEAGKYNRVVDIGDKPQGWKQLPGTDGKEHALADLTDAKAVAVIFTCNDCPVAIAYQDRIKQLAKDYGDQGLQVIAINVNKGESIFGMKLRAKAEDFQFPYLYDESQETAKSYGAVCTPHVFLLDGKRAIAYMGAFDDNWQSLPPFPRSTLRMLSSPYWMGSHLRSLNQNRLGVLFVGTANSPRVGEAVDPSQSEWRRSPYPCLR